MPLYEVVLQQSYFGQEVINRFNYLGSGTPASVTGSFGLLSAMGFIPTSTTLLAGTVGAGIQGIQNAACSFVQALARAIYLDDDFFDNPFFANTVGGVGGLGDPVSPVNAFGFRSNRVKQSIGRGYKRFAGMSEGDTDSGGVLTTSAGIRLTNLRNEMGATLTYDDSGNTLTFTPCVAQKLKYTTPSGKTAYKYYPTEAAQAPHIANGIAWEFYPQLRTQTSRQYGRGS
jgi:hypothetical protein